jgi:hydroxymethylbilane synthase
MAGTTLRIATRKSKLALTQTRWVAARVRERVPDVTVEEVHVVTKGDEILDRPLATIGGKGLFVSEVEAALTDGRADIAVHSMKDVPAELAEGLGLVCIPKREDPHDVLVTAEGTELDGLEAGARVGTSSLRRTCQLKAHRPDLDYATLRGNVDTRLRKLDEGQYAAIVLAKAGMARLSLLDRPHWVVPEEISIPAAGQGALGIEARLDDMLARAMVEPLEDLPTRICVEAERVVIRRLEASCKVPVAAFARLGEGNRLTLRAMVGSLDGTKILHAATDAYLEGNPEAHVAEARTLGDEVADNLLAKGARELVLEANAAMERAQKSGNGGGGTYGKWS